MKYTGLAPRALLAFVFVAAIALTARSAGAQAGIQFSIQPANANEADPAKGAYFTYTLAPGGSVSDTAVVMNSGGSPIELKLYAADGVTAIGGGTAFGADGESRFGVSPWLSTAARSIAAAAGERVNVPFTVNVPADAAPGDHIAGWVVEAPPRAGTSGGVQTAITERAGVAVVVRVPGETTEELVVADICMNQETGSNYVQVSVGNAGNVLSKATGTLTVTRGSGNGQEVFNAPMDVGTVLPADGTFIRVDSPVDLGPGSYIANVALTQTDGRSVVGSGKLSIRPNKENGCAEVNEVSGATVVARRAPAVTPLDSDSGGPPWITIGLAGLAGLFALLFGLSLRRQRRHPSDGD